MMTKKSVAYDNESLDNIFDFLLQIFFRHNSFNDKGLLQHFEYSVANYISTQQLVKGNKVHLVHLLAKYKQSFRAAYKLSFTLLVVLSKYSNKKSIDKIDRAICKSSLLLIKLCLQINSIAIIPLKEMFGKFAISIFNFRN